MVGRPKQGSKLLLGLVAAPAPLNLNLAAAVSEAELTSPAVGASSDCVLADFAEAETEQLGDSLSERYPDQIHNFSVRRTQPDKDRQAVSFILLTRLVSFLLKSTGLQKYHIQRGEVAIASLLGSASAPSSRSLYWMTSARSCQTPSALWLWSTWRVCGPCTGSAWRRCWRRTGRTTSTDSPLCSGASTITRTSVEISGRLMRPIRSITLSTTCQILLGKMILSL